MSGDCKKSEEPACRLFVVVATVLVLRLALAAAVGGAQETGTGARAVTEPASAKTAPVRSTTQWLPRVRLDNDAYNFWIRPGKRSDEEYTNGVTLAIAALRAPFWGRRLGGGAPGCADGGAPRGPCLSTELSIAHEMYTPDLDHPPFSYPGWRDERPYAALLYVGAEGRRHSARALRTYTLNLGVTGPPALGRFTQSIAHTLAARYTTKAEGWETQVGFEPAVLVGMRQSVLAARWAPGGHGVFDVAPSVGASLGNVRTSADVGARVRVGANLSHPWDPRAWRGRPAWEFQVNAAGRREYVARDFSLDGASFRSGERHVERVASVKEYEVGTAIRLHRLSVGYRAITRSREYTTGPSRHVFSQMYTAMEFHP